MALSPRTVLIPLARLGHDGGRVARIEAAAGPPAPHPAGLNPQIAGLADWGLYEAGAIALGAIGRIGLRPGGLALAQRLRPGSALGGILGGTGGSAGGHLAATNGPDIGELAPGNGRSAELGLALALLMHAGQSSAPVAIATGALARDAAPTAAARTDVAVEPVAHIDRKIEALKRALVPQKGGAHARRVLFFLPAETDAGEATLTAHAAGLKALRDAYARHGVEIEACPVASLREALDRLGVKTLKATAGDLWLASGIAGVLMAAAILLAFQRWLAAPLDLAFAPVPLTGGRAAAPSPVRAIYETGEDRFRMRPACLGAQRLPTYRVGESLVFRAVLRSPGALAAALGGYHFAVVGVSERSGVKVYPPQTFGRIGASAGEVPAALAGFDLSAVVPIRTPAEKSKLIILVRRLRPFDTRALHAELTAAVADKPPGARINAVVNRLAGYAPGYLDYSFQSVEGQTGCEPG